MKIEYSENNSGGYFRLKEEHYKALESAGWSVDWKVDTTLKSLGRQAYRATRETLSENMAKAEWAALTGFDPDDEGCSCCGQPHNFYAP